MKIYRNKDPKIIGVKYETVFDYPMVLIQASGEYPGAVEIEFTHRDEKNDFNSDADYLKDYDATIEGVFEELLGILDGFETEEFFIVETLSYAPSRVRIEPVHGKYINSTDLDCTIRRLCDYAKDAAIH